MKIDDIIILKYVEGLLDVKQVSNFEQEMAVDTELQRSVEAMQASQLPYQAAFNQTSSDAPSMPENLRSKVADIHQEFARNQLTQTTSKKIWQQPLSPRLVAASVLLAFVFGGLSNQLLNKSSRQHTIVTELNQTNQMGDYGGRALIDAMLTYQALYSRDTVATVIQLPASRDQALNRFNASTRRQLKVPQLENYQFKRLQTLDYSGQPIAQMVYLNDHGLPIALCATPVSTQSLEAIDYQLADMNTVVWVDNNIAYMLMGKNSPTALHQLRQLLKFEA